MMEITQINLNHCEVAQDLLWQNMAESSCDVVMISEPYKVPCNDDLWVADTCKGAAINVSRKYPIQEVVSISHEGFVVAKINGIYFCSCYAPPRWSITEFEKMLDTLVNVVSNKKPIVIGGDFNAWAKEWGSKSTNKRGQSLLEAFAQLDICIANEGSRSTFHRNGNESVIDVTFCSPSLINNMNWRVTEEYSASDHHIIKYNVGITPRGRVATGKQDRRWNTKELSKELLCESFGLAVSRKQELTPRQLTNIVIDSCDMAMPRKALPKYRRAPAYWWSDQIAELRAKCNKARRQAQRAKRDVDRTYYRGIHKELRAELSQAIKDSKRVKFKELCEGVNDNPWGAGYKIVMNKLKGQLSGRETRPDKLKDIVDTLFPTHMDTEWANQHSKASTLRERVITNEELLSIARELNLKKAPGPDGIPNEVLKILIQRFPTTFRDVFQKCLDDCYFPDMWKKQKLVLLPKPCKNAGEPVAYRPLCLLDTLGKILEKIILNRLVDYSESEEGLSDKQYGFRRKRSTIDAISRVVNQAQKAIDSHTKANRYCAVTTIDVKNAFNSANWGLIIKAFSEKGVSEQLCEIMKSYLSNRVLVYDTEKGKVTRRVNSGVPQGSILGPACWSLFYDGILRLDLPEGVEIVGFADDVVLTAVGDSIEEVNIKVEWAIRLVSEWLEANQLQMAHHKTEIVVVTNRRQPITTHIKVGDNVITSQRQVKYLGVMVDDRLGFSRHVDYVCEKAAKVQKALARIMPNTFGPISSKRRMIANVTTSVLRYGCEVWGKALDKQRNSEIINRIHRLSALRIASGYRTVSYDAACIIAGLMPIELVLKEDKKCWESKKSKGVTERPEHREQSLLEWQNRWDNSMKGRWTHRLIPQIKPWIQRTHGEVDFFVTQFLSGHGNFGAYRYKIGKTDSPLCHTCRTVIETPEHLLFECVRFNDDRKIMYNYISPMTTIDSLINSMCETEEAWKGVADFMSKVANTLRADDYLD